MRIRINGRTQKVEGTGLNPDTIMLHSVMMVDEHNSIDYGHLTFRELCDEMRESATLEDRLYDLDYITVEAAQACDDSDFQTMLTKILSDIQERQEQ